MNEIFKILAALFAGISGFCLFCIGVDLIRALHYEEDPGSALEQDILKRYYERLPIFVRMMLPLTGPFMRMAQSNFFASQSKNTASLLMQSGFGQVIAPAKFLAARLALAAVGLVFGILIGLSGHIFYGLILVVLLYLYPQVWLTRIRNARHLEIQKALPNVLDLLTLSVEAGKDFLTSMRDILKRRHNDALSEELLRTFQEIQLGKSRRDALRELSMRVQQPDLTAVMNAIIQADELGVSIGQILRIQGDQLRIKRFQRADKLANETPTKILLPMVVFIFPAVFIILLAPIAYTYIAG